MATNPNWRTLFSAWSALLDELARPAAEILLVQDVASRPPRQADSLARAFRACCAPRPRSARGGLSRRAFWRRNIRSWPSRPLISSFSLPISSGYSLKSIRSTSSPAIACTGLFPAGCRRSTFAGTGWRGCSSVMKPSGATPGWAGPAGAAAGWDAGSSAFAANDAECVFRLARRRYFAASLSRAAPPWLTSKFSPRRTTSALGWPRFRRVGPHRKPRRPHVRCDADARGTVPVVQEAGFQCGGVKGIPVLDTAPDVTTNLRAQKIRSPSCASP